MLFIICGVSCVGKSTIIRMLHSSFGFSILPTYMTRPLREGEKEKISITSEKFAKLENEGFFRFVNHLFGNSYGTPKQEAALAASENQPWLIDFPVHQVSDAFADLTYQVVIVDPENNEQLRKHIKLAERSDRLVEIFDELSREYGKKIDHSVNLRVTNFEGQPESAARMINNFYLSRSFDQ